MATHRLSRTAAQTFTAAKREVNAAAKRLSLRYLNQSIEQLRAAEKKWRASRLSNLLP